jgi:hypothetical protein
MATKPAWARVGVAVMFAGAAACGGATAGGATGDHDAGGDSDVATGASGSNGGSPAGTSGVSPEAGFGSSETSVTASDANTDAAILEASTDAAAEAGCASGTDPTLAEWPMPNVPSDSDAGTPNTESYTDNGDGTVTDNVTGLVWQRATTLAGTLSGSPDNQSSTSSEALANAAVWSAAAASCQSLALAGHDDWRLPTLIELVSIDHLGVYPALDPMLFPDWPWDAATGEALVMSGTPEAGSPNVWWIMHADGGQVGNGAASADQSLLYHCVRAPHQNPSACRYADPVGGTVLDTKTSLAWQQAAAPGGMTESDAVAYCAALSASGGGWRLPTGRELLTLVDYTQTFPLLNQTAFPGSAATFDSSIVYWSSTNGGTLWNNEFLDVRFDLGNTEYNAPSQTNSVRCVR